MDNGLSLADAMALKDDNGMNGNCWIWIIVLFLFMWAVEIISIEEVRKIVLRQKMCKINSTFQLLKDRIMKLYLLLKNHSMKQEQL